MRTEPKWSIRKNRSTCGWKFCTRDRWSPYSWEFCAYHFARNALLIDRERKHHDLSPIAVTWARSRFCGVLNGYTPELGDVAWDTHYPREELAQISDEELGLKLSPIKEAQWRTARGQVAAGYSKQWRRAYRTPPGDYEGPGARRSLSREQARHVISTDYSGGGSLV